MSSLLLCVTVFCRQLKAPSNADAFRIETSFEIYVYSYVHTRYICIYWGILVGHRAISVSVGHTRTLERCDLSGKCPRLSVVSCVLYYDILGLCCVWAHWGIGAITRPKITHTHTIAWERCTQMNIAPHRARHRDVRHCSRRLAKPFASIIVSDPISRGFLCFMQFERKAAHHPL